MFTQHININEINMTNSQEFIENCKKYPECVGCPFKNGAVQLCGGITICETGRRKDGNNG